MSRVRCPKCATVVEVAPGDTPVCPTCGFGAPPGAVPPAPPGSNVPPTSQPPPADVSGPATPPSPAPLAGPSDPWGTGQAEGYGAPTTPGAAVAHHGGEPGKVREPGIIVLLYIVTFGIYGLVWHWKTGEEVDRFRPEARASGVLKGHVWAAIATLVLALIAFAIIGGALFSALSEAIQEDREPTDEEVWDAIVGASLGLVFILLAVATSITSEVLKLIGMWRVWNTVADEQRRLRMEPLNPVLLLLFLLSPILSEVVQVPFAFIPVLGGIVGFLLGIAVIVLLILAYVWTQQGLNQVWRAHGAQG